MIEKQVIVSWYKPDQKLPPDGEAVPATVSGKSGSHYMHHALVTAEFYEGEGWFVEGFDTDKKGAWLEVHAWADLKPYEVNKKQIDLIRCKDCKYRIINKHFGEKGYSRLKASCELDTGDPYCLGREAETDDWFCADAERREDA